MNGQCNVCGEPLECPKRHYHWQVDARKDPKNPDDPMETGVGPIDWEAKADISLDLVRGEPDVEAAHRAMVKVLQWAFRQGQRATPDQSVAQDTRIADNKPVLEEVKS